RKQLWAMGVEVGRIDAPAMRDWPALIDALADRSDYAAVGGSDGTLNFAVGDIMRNGLTLGVLPLGSANDIARPLVLPTARAPDRPRFPHTVVSRPARQHRRTTPGHPVLLLHRLHPHRQSPMGRAGELPAHVRRRTPAQRASGHLCVRVRVRAAPTRPGPCP